MVAVYAVLHDQYLVRIAPEHFTVYHPPLWGIKNTSLLAAAWSFQASLYPGIVLGMACLLAARAGGWPRVGARFVFRAVPLLIGATEAVSALAGLIVLELKHGIYPDEIYPDHRLPLLVTQTIQVTCYAAAAVFSALLIAWILIRRFRAHHRVLRAGSPA